MKTDKKLKTKEKVSWKVTKADGSVTEKTEEIVVEHFMEVSVNGEKAFTLSCTPECLRELVVGRLYTERIIKNADDIESLFISDDGNICEVVLKEGVENSDGKNELPVLPEVSIDSQSIFKLAEKFSEDGNLHRSTNGTHSCYIRLENGSIVSFEDIGRHNALDKAVGYILLKNRSTEGIMIYTTGRVSTDMVEKTVAAGIPVLVSKAVPTSKALELAKRYGLKLICKAWPDSFCMKI